MKNKFFYVVIGLLLSVIVYQFKTRNGGEGVQIQTDTLYVQTTVHDTIYSKPRIIKSKPDTVWQSVYVPDTNYNVLVKQYEALGNQLFATNVFQNKYSLGAAGSISVTDTVKENKLIGSSYLADLILHEKTVVVREQAPPASYFYLGPMVTASSHSFGGHLGLLYKSKKEQILGAHVGWNGWMQYGLGYYWKIKL